MVPRNLRTLPLIPIFLVFVLAATGLQAPDNAPPSHVIPKTQATEVKELIQGVEIIDPYRWLEDQDSPATRSWIAEQNAYTDSVLAELSGREKLRQQLNALIRIDVTAMPAVHNGRYFFYQRLAGQEQMVLYMRKGVHGKDEMLVDPQPLSPDHTTSTNVDAISEDGSLLVYSLRAGGEDESTPFLLDVNERRLLPDRFPKARYSSFALLRDKTGVYFSKRTEDGPRAYFHKIGDDSAHDIEIFGKGYTTEDYIACRISEDGRYLGLFVDYGASSDRSDVYAKDLANNAPIVAVVKDLEASFEPTDYGESIVNHKMYLRTNWKTAHWRIIEVDLNNPAREHWREVVPESDAVLEGFTLVGGHISARLTQNAVSHLRLFDLSGKMLREINPPALGSTFGIFGPWDGHEGFYAFDSFHIPRTVYRCDLATNRQTIWSQRRVPLDSARYEVQQVWYSSKDGTKIPMFLAHAKGLQLNASNPTLLTGYGGFDISFTPQFDPFAAAWMENGGVYAVANLRGGGEFGEPWHHAGMLEKKQNVFDDFIAAAEWLITNKYTNPSRLAIRGTSNGGLLVGAALTQRPDLFAAVICRYPLLDMLRYQKFLVAKYWVSEYGSADDPEQFKYIYGYSPYQHVKPGTKYPAVLLISGDSDTRVAPLHARKMTALLQADTASGKPIMLRYETKAGHASNLSTTLEVNNLSEELAFLVWQLGMKM